MQNEPMWRSEALKRQIREGAVPENVEELEALEVAATVARILGTKSAADAPTPEDEPEPLSKAEQRRTDRRAAERARRFGRG